MKFSRDVSIKPSVIVLDGISGTGKTLLGPLLAQLSDFAPPRFFYSMEWLAVGLHKNCVDASFAHVWFKLVFDQLAYDSQISREINFRPRDLSTNFGYGNRIKALRGLWRKDGAHVGDRIKHQELGITLITHQLFPTFPELIPVFDREVIVIQAVRRPSDLLEHWTSYVGRHGSCATDFTVLIESQFGAAPWFMSSDPARYFTLDMPNRAALLLCDLFESLFRMKGANDLANSVLFIPFEKFILSPHSFLNEIAFRTGKPFKKRLHTEMRKQRVPRSIGEEGKRDQAYDRYKLSRQFQSDAGGSVKSKLILSLETRVLERLMKADSEYEKLFLATEL